MFQNIFTLLERVIYHINLIESYIIDRFLLYQRLLLAHLLLVVLFFLFVLYKLWFKVIIAEMMNLRFLECFVILFVKYRFKLISIMNLILFAKRGGIKWFVLNIDRITVELWLLSFVCKHTTWPPA